MTTPANAPVPPKKARPKFSSAVVIDLDDTLYLETAYARSGYRAVARHFRLDEDEHENLMWAFFNSGERRTVLTRWLAEIEAPPEKLARAIEVYRNHVPDLKPIPGWIELLRSWKGVYGRGVVSDGPLKQQESKVIGSGIRAHVDAIVLSDALGGPDHWKPSPEPFELCLEKLGVTDPSKAVYIADNPHKDFLGARRAGMKSIRLRWPGGLHEAVDPKDADHAPDVECSSLEEVARLVPELIGPGNPKPACVPPQPTVAETGVPGGTATPGVAADVGAAAPTASPDIPSGVASTVATEPPASPSADGGVVRETPRENREHERSDARTHEHEKTGRHRLGELLLGGRHEERPDRATGEQPDEHHG